jgi:hypothetical protein
MKDGASLVGGLLFTSLNSYNFGQNIKIWRLFADMINNVGITLNMLAPLFPRYFLPIVCIASICSSLCGIAAGATNAVINSHWGSMRQGNLADVLAKNQAQHTMLSLIGLACSIPFAQFAEQVRPEIMWMMYLTLTMIHIVSNYQAMRILALKSINPSRLDLLLSHFLQHPVIFPLLDISSTISHRKSFSNQRIEQIKFQLRNDPQFSPATIAKVEPIGQLILPHWIRKYFDTLYRRKSESYEIIPWVSLSTLFAAGIRINDLIPLKSKYLQKQYMIIHIKDKIYILFDKQTRLEDQMEAYFEAAILREVKEGDKARELTTLLFPIFWNSIQVGGWDTSASSLLKPYKASTYVMR